MNHGRSLIADVNLYEQVVEHSNTIKRSDALKADRNGLQESKERVEAALTQAQAEKVRAAEHEPCPHEGPQNNYGLSMNVSHHSHILKGQLPRLAAHACAVLLNS